GDFRQLRETFGEFRLEIGEDAEEIIAKQDLAIAADAGADANGWYCQLLRDEFCDSGRHRLELQHETAGVLDSECVFQDFHRRVRSPALNFEATEHGNGVWREPNVGSGGNSSVDQCTQDVSLRFAALRLHRIAERFLHETRGI